MIVPITVYFKKRLTFFCDCNEFATIITLLLQIYVSNDYGV